MTAGSGQPRKNGLGAWLDIRPGHHRPRRVLQGAISSAVFIGFVYVLFLKPPLLPSGDTTVRALFRDAPQLRVNQATPVRVAGVDVGKVKKYGPGPGGRGALVELSIEKGHGVKVKRDARLTILYRTVLGRNMYIDLEPGSRGTPPLGNDVLPASRTVGPVELDQVLYPLDARGRRAVKGIVDEAHRAVADPKGPQAALPRLAPTLKDLGPGLKALRGTRPGDLATLLNSTQRASAGLAHDERELDQLIYSSRVALGVTAAKRADLEATLDQAPASFADVRTTADRLETTLDLLDPLARRFRAGARGLPSAASAARAALTVARPLLSDARPLVTDLRPAVSRLGRAARAGLPVVRGLDPSLGRALSDFLPWLDERDPELKMKNYEMVGPTVAAAAGAFIHYDANGHTIAFDPGVGTNAIQPTNLPCRVHQPTLANATTLACQDAAMATVVGELLGAPSRQLRALPRGVGGRLGVAVPATRLSGAGR